MKKILLIINIILSPILWGEISLKIDRFTPYLGETVYVLIEAPGDDIHAGYRLNIKTDDYEVIKDQVVHSLNSNPQSKTQKNSVIYKIQLYFKSPGIKNIKAFIGNNESNEKELFVKDINYSSLPFSRSYISKDSIYENEITLFSIELFSNNYIYKADYNNEISNLISFNLGHGSNNNIRYLHSNQDGKYKRVINYGITSSTKGIYRIPESLLSYNDIEFKIPSREIEVLRIPPKAVNSVVGHSLNIKLEDFKSIYRYSDDINFKVKIYGNSNLSQITSLKDFSKLPSYFKEEIADRGRYIKNDEYFEIITFRYTSQHKSIFGLKLPKIEIPFFNVESNSVSSIEHAEIFTKGMFSLKVAIIISSFLLLVTFIIILLLLRRTKQQAVSESETNSLKEVISGFELSKREKEIFEILIVGKSNKEIADELCISPETVKKHIQNIYKKTQTKSRVELIALIYPSLSS